MIARAVTALFLMAAALAGGVLPAASQANLYPSTLQPNTVIGRTGISAGPPQAIPFSILIQNLQNTPNLWTQPQSYGSVTNPVGLNFLYPGTSTIATPGGTNPGGGVPQLLFAPSTPLSAPNTILVGFGTANPWPFTYNDYQAATVSIIDPYGAGSLALAMRTSDRRTGSANPTNLLMTTVHDNPSAGTPASNVWGIFQIAWKTAAAFGSGALLTAYEQSVLNLGTAVYGDPYNINPADGTFGWRIDSGDDLGTGNAVTNAIDIINNCGSGTGTCGQFGAGIRFGNTSIAQVAGHYNAIQFPAAYELDWYSAIGTISGEITTDAGGILQLVSVGGEINIFPAAGFAQLNWGMNGTNYISANNGGSSFFQFQVNSVNVAALSATALAIAATTAATSPTTGSLRTAGGLGVAGAAYIGGTLGLTPATWADNQTCAAGQISVDASFIYVCTASNTVKRATLATF